MRFRLKTKGFPRYGAPGLRGKVAALLLLLAAPAWGDPVTVLALGDSLTQGYGLPQEKGFVPQLESWVADQGVEAAFINAGVSGDTSAGGAARVGWSLTKEVDAMIVALGGNDLLRGIDPAVTRGNLKKILQTAQEREVPVLLVGMHAPGNFGPEYKRAFDQLYPDLAEAYDTLFYESFFKDLGEGDPARMRQYFQEDGLHPNAKGVTAIVEDMGPDVLRLIERAE
jgi:acyl-CoA thioesterase-1